MNSELEKLVLIARNEAMFPEVLKTMYGLLKDNEPMNRELRLALSLNRNCPVEVLEKEIKDPVDEIRVNVAKHKRATEKMLASCVKDPNPNVRMAAVNNTNASEDTLWQFAKDDNPEVVKSARAALKARL